MNPNDILTKKPVASSPDAAASKPTSDSSESSMATTRPLSRAHPFEQGFWTQVASYIRRQDPKQDLSSLLSTAKLQKTRLEKIQWLSRLAHWHRTSHAIDSLARFKFFLQALRRQPEWAADVSDIFASVLFETDATTVLTRVEMTEHAGLFTDSFRRVGDLFLPPVPRPDDLSYVVDMVFTGDKDAEWVAQIAAPEWFEFLAILNESRTQPDPLPRLEEALRRSILHLAVQVSSLSLHPDIRERTGRETISESPFLTLSKIAFREDDHSSPSNVQNIIDTVELCRFALRQVHRSIEKKGVSIDLLYRQETLTSLLNRVESLTRDSLSKTGEDFSQSLVVEILRTHQARRSLVQIYKLNLDIFARKLVEHAGETGEHYISRNKREYFAMLYAGAGGGLVTVPMTVIKFLVYSLSAPLAIEGGLIAINYSICFLAMQFLGFSLATKQPSMTAAALANRIHRRMTEIEKQELMHEVARITRSQFVAAVGNVLFVVIGAFVLSILYHTFFHHGLLSEHFAQHMLNDLDPTRSLSWWYAAITGVFLWLSSICAGWLQNWVNMRGLVEAIRLDRRLVAVFGESRIRRFSEWVSRNISAIGGNIAIGLFMGLIPIVGKFSGLPIDIRHITLSSGTFVFSILSLPLGTIPWTTWALPMLGLVGIGILNFSVSFTLALVVAILSRKMPLAWLRVFFRNFGKGFASHPLMFLYPTDQSESSDMLVTDGELATEKHAALEHNHVASQSGRKLPRV